MLLPRIGNALSKFLSPITSQKRKGVVSDTRSDSKTVSESSPQPSADFQQDPSQQHSQSSEKETPRNPEKHEEKAGHATRLLLEAYRILREQNQQIHHMFGLKTYLKGPKTQKKSQKLSKGIIVNERVK